MIKKNCYEFTDNDLLLIASILDSSMISSLTKERFKRAKDIGKKLARYVRLDPKDKKSFGAYVPNGRIIFIKES